MLSYVTYKTIHFTALAMVLLSLGAAMLHHGTGLSKRWISASHGIGLLLLLISGFGMLAKLGLTPYAGWVGGKVALWLFLGGCLALIPRLRKQAPVLWIAVLAAVAIAAQLAQTKLL